jgi:non-heme chloroperoxidase
MLKKNAAFTFFSFLFCFFLQLSLEAHCIPKNELFDLKYHYVDNNGVKIAYTSHGSKNRQSIVLIHGYPLNSEEYICQIHGLKEFFHVITLDLRGYGHSDKSLDIEYSYPAFVSDVNAVVQALELKNPAIVGFSFGTIVAELYAATNPNISKLILISPFAGQVVNGNGYTLGIDLSVLEPSVGIIETNRKEADKLFVQAAVPETCSGICKIKKFLVKVAELNPTANLVKFLPVMLTTGFPQVISEIFVPTLLLHGIDDSITNLDGVLYIRQVIPNSQLDEFPGGHMINVTQSKWVNKAIFDFIKEENKCHDCLCPSKE